MSASSNIKKIPDMIRTGSSNLIESVRRGSRSLGSNFSRSLPTLPSSQSSSSSALRTVVPLDKRLPLPLLRDIQLQGSLWGLRGMVKDSENERLATSSSNSSSSAHVSPNIRHWRGSIVESSRLLNVLNSYCLDPEKKGAIPSEKRLKVELVNTLTREVMQKLYVNTRDLYSLKNRLKLLIDLISSNEKEIQLRQKFRRLFELRQPGYVRVQVFNELVESVMNAVFENGDVEIRKKGAVILSPWKKDFKGSHSYHFSSILQYIDIDEVPILQSRPDIRKQIENELGLSQQSVTGALTKATQTALRESGIVRLLKMVGLDKYTIPSIKYELLTADAKETVLLMPRVETKAINVSKQSKERKGFTFLSRDKKCETDSLFAVGIIHALLQVQNGFWGNVAFVEESQSVCCYDLGKSLIPVKVVKDVRLKEDQEMTGSMEVSAALTLTLQTFIWTTDYFDASIPNHIHQILKDDIFIEGFAGECLRRYLPKGDFLLQNDEMCAMAEKALRQRASHLHITACTAKVLTLRNIYRTLYPDEMIFVETAQRLGLDVYPEVYPEEILTEAKKSLDEKESQALEKALERLKKCTLSNSEYSKLM